MTSADGYRRPTANHSPPVWVAVASGWPGAPTRTGRGSRSPSNGSTSSQMAVAERGMGTMMIMAVVLLLMMLAGMIGIGGQYLVAKHRAQRAADLAALAGAQSLGSGKNGCVQARTYAKKNDRRVADCKIAGDTGDFVLTIRVEAPVPVRVGMVPRNIAVSANAGPVR